MASRLRWLVNTKVKLEVMQRLTARILSFCICSSQAKAWRSAATCPRSKQSARGVVMAAARDATRPCVGICGRHSAKKPSNLSPFSTGLSTTCRLHLLPRPNPGPRCSHMQPATSRRTGGSRQNQRFFGSPSTGARLGPASPPSTRRAWPRAPCQLSRHGRAAQRQAQRPWS